MWVWVVCGAVCVCMCVVSCPDLLMKALSHICSVCYVSYQTNCTCQMHVIEFRHADWGWCGGGGVVRVVW